MSQLSQPSTRNRSLAKDNQHTLATVVANVFDEVLGVEDTPLEYHTCETRERDHGRIETRQYHMVARIVQAVASRAMHPGRKETVPTLPNARPWSSNDPCY